MAKETIEIDINGENVPPGVKDLQPNIYKEGNTIFVVEADAPDLGIVGIGKSVTEAMDNFQRKYEESKQDSL